MFDWIDRNSGKNEPAPKECSDWDRMVAEAKEEDQRRRDEADAKLKEYIADDRADAVEALNFEAQVSVVNRKAGPFLKVDDDLFPMAFIESIEITKMGADPYMWESSYPNYSRYESSYFIFDEARLRDRPMPGTYHACGAGKSIITVTLSSGRTHEIKCSRHVVEMCHDALVKAWQS